MSTSNKIKNIRVQIANNLNKFDWLSDDIDKRTEKISRKRYELECSCDERLGVLNTILGLKEELKLLTELCANNEEVKDE